MITQEEFIKMKVLKKQGKSIRQIANETGRSRNTVRKSLRSNEMPKYPKKPKVASKLDPYKEYLKKRVKQAEPYFLPAPVLLKEIQEQGYQGKLTILKDFLTSSGNILIKNILEKQKLSLETGKISVSILLFGKLLIHVHKKNLYFNDVFF